MKCKLVHPHAVLPRRHTEGAVGYDLHSVEQCAILPGFSKTIDTGVAFEIPTGYEGQVRPRSGITNRHGVLPAIGVVDPDYRGSVSVTLFNHGRDMFYVNVGDRIAQLVISAVATPELELVEELSATERGEKRYGSTGAR